MALELKYASDATVLLTDLVDSLGRPSSPAGVVVPVLMPSLPLVDRTKAELARRHGVAMGVEFLLPGSFIERMAYGAKKRPRLGRCWSSRPSSLRLCRLRCSSSSSRSLAG